MLSSDQHAAVFGIDATTFSLDDFDAFDILMASGWCFNPDFAHHSIEGHGGDHPVPGQEVFAHLSLFLWDATTGALSRLASSLTGAGKPLVFRIPHESWLDDEWMDGNGSDSTQSSWDGGRKQIAAVHLALQQMGVGGVGEIVAAPAKAFGETDTAVGMTKVPRSSQVRSGIILSLNALTHESSTLLARC